MALTSQGKLAAATFTDTKANSSGEVVNAASTVAYGIEADNSQNTEDSYLKLFNKTTAPTLGTDAPISIVRLPAASKRTQTLGDLGVGLTFSAGLAFAVVTTPGVAGSVAPENDVEVILKTD